MERMPRLGKANAQTSCCLAKPPLWIYMHDVGFLKWIYLKVRHVLKGRAVIFSFPPQSGASFIDGAMNLACCVRGTFWWWIQVAVPEIALRFGAHLMALFSWYWTERALVRALWGCTRGFPPLWICGFLLLCLHCQNKCCCSKKQKTKKPNLLYITWTLTVLTQFSLKMLWIVIQLFDFSLTFLSVSLPIITRHKWVRDGNP